MGVITAIVLLVIAMALFFAARKGFVDNRTLQIIADVATIVALLAAVLVFIIPIPEAPIVTNAPTQGAGKPFITEMPNIGKTATREESSMSLETPRPTLIPVSDLDEIARDDFSSTSTKWDVFSEEYGSAGYENGKYCISLSEFRLFISLWEGAGEIDNAVLQVDVLKADEDTNYNQGIGFGWHEDWEGSAYAFTLNTLGVCDFWAIDDGKYWRVKVTGKVDEFDAQRSFHTLKVYIRNSQAIGYVDDTFCAEYTMPNYKQGYVGVVASPSRSRNGKIGKYYFDEYRIFRLP